MANGGMKHPLGELLLCHKIIEMLKVKIILVYFFILYVYTSQLINFFKKLYYFADISFDRKVRPLSVDIYETYHPGSVVRIWASDGFEKWKLLWEGPPQVRDHMPNIFSPPINKINFCTK